MAVNPQIIMAVVEATRNEKVRKFILTAVLFFLGLIIFISSLYGGLISGVLCIIQSITLKADWSYYSKSISDVFDDVKTELSDELIEEVYDYMPDFSYNLAKALISADNTTTYYDEDIPAVYKYTLETITVGGDNAKRQALTIEDGEESQYVEYICVGGEIYLPEFLAMYNVHQQQKYLIAADEADADDINSDMEELVGNIPETEEEFAKYIKEVWKESIEDSTSANVGIFKTAALKSIIADAVKNGAAEVEIDRSDKKLSITLYTLSSDDWKDVFEIDESLWQYVEEQKMTIEMALNSAQIPEEQRTISLDAIVQDGLFRYFDGLFNLPLSTAKIKGYEEYGTPSDLHIKDNEKRTNDGITLLLDERHLIRHSLIENRFIESSFVYDVWNIKDDNREIKEKSKVNNHSAITLAYIIDLKEFTKTYGFDFPDIEGINTDSGYVTLLVEYSCLDKVNYAQSNVGSSIPDDEELSIGRTNNGEFDVDREQGTYHHLQENSQPHLVIKLAICSDKLDKPSSEDDEKYNGISGSLGTGVNLNPRLWINGLVSDGNLPEGVSAAQPKK